MRWHCLDSGQVREADNSTLGSSAVSVAPTGPIVRKGIARINATGVIKIIESLRVTGGTKLDQLTGFLDFGMQPRHYFGSYFPICLLAPDHAVGHALCSTRGC